MSDLTRFELTEDHIKLLRRAYVTWQDCEVGAPCIDPKRPYGNTSVDLDVIDILGWGSRYARMPAQQREAAKWLHLETEQALRVVLGSGSFEPGVYVRSGYSNEWTWAGRENEAVDQ